MGGNFHLTVSSNRYSSLSMHDNNAAQVFYESDVWGR